MHYFGCKEQIFATACHLDVEEMALAERVLLGVGEKLRQEPVSEQALLRSMLTHDQAPRPSAAPSSPASAECWPGPSEARRPACGRGW
ncbi:MAG: hypothetical protein ACRD0L_12065 [Acidimicrobiales bacterium]